MSIKDNEEQFKRTMLAACMQIGGPHTLLPINLQNQTAQALPKPDLSRYQLTHAEALDRAQLLALFDKLDARGQRTTLAMLAVAVKLHPRDPA